MRRARFFQSTVVGILSALFSAISVWHIFFSRYGERVALLVLLTVGAYWFFWRALDQRRWRDFAYAGIFIGLGLDTYPAARVLPVPLLLLAAYCVWTDRVHWREYTKGLALALSVAVAFFLPLGVYFAGHPDQFISHSADVSIFVPHEGEQGNVPAALAANTVRLAKMFFVEGDRGAIRNVPGRPVFDPFLGVLFVIGVLVALMSLVSPRGSELNRRRAALLLVWMLVALGVSLFTDDAPNFVRTLPAFPAVMMLAAWGAVEMWKRTRMAPARKLAVGALAVAVAASTVLAFRDYFVVFAGDPSLYYVFNADKEDVSDWINQNATSNEIFLAPVWYEVGTISLLTRNAPLKSFDSRDTIVLPSRANGKDALFVFPYEQERRAQTMQARLGDLGRIENWNGSNGQKLFLFYHVPSANLPDAKDPLGVLARGSPFVEPQQRTSAIWENRIELLGYRTDMEGPGSRNPVMTLFLRGLARMSEDYTFSLKVHDGHGQVWGQQDKWTGDNSYPTTEWGVGDLVVERFYPEFESCTQAGEYSASVEAYNPKTMQVLSLSNRDTALVVLGEFHMDGPANCSASADPLRQPL